MGKNVESVDNQHFFSLTPPSHTKEYVLYTQLNVNKYGWFLFLNNAGLTFAHNLYIVDLTPSIKYKTVLGFNGGMLINYLCMYVCMFIL